MLEGLYVGAIGPVSDLHSKSLTSRFATFSSL
jgi:hypothetical protein